jgi:hypothetical protein
MNIKFSSNEYNMETDSIYFCVRVHSCICIHQKYKIDDKIASACEPGLSVNIPEVDYQSCITLNVAIFAMDDSSYRRNFDLGKKNEIHYHSWKEHFRISKIAKFVCELL